MLSHVASYHTFYSTRTCSHPLCQLNLQCLGDGVFEKRRLVRLFNDRKNELCILQTVACFQNEHNAKIANRAMAQNAWAEKF